MTNTAYYSMSGWSRVRVSNITNHDAVSPTPTDADVPTPYEQTATQTHSSNSNIATTVYYIEGQTNWAPSPAGVSPIVHLECIIAIAHSR